MVQCIDPNAVTRLRRIGEGGNGKCYLVRRNRDQKLLVHKVDKHSASTEKERYFLRRILPRHRRIVKLEHEADSPAGGGLFYEYCPGGDLGALIDSFREKRRYFPEVFIWHVFHKLAEALAFIHYGYLKSHPSERPLKWREVVHRDVKPQNIFLRAAYSDNEPFVSIVLGDFGSATVHHKSACYTTLKYQPPELPTWTAKGDVWGMGAVIHSLIHYQPPFKSPRTSELISHGDFEGWAMSPKSHRPREVPMRYSAALDKDLMDTLALDARRRRTSLELCQSLNARDGDS
ncbi:MAG: hypothetical protein Q9217_005746 [Psora testacea]